MKNKFLNLAIRFLKKLETKSSYYLGKGYGSTSVSREVELATTLLPSSPKLIIDIGANLGNYTDAILKKYPNVEIHVIEPSPLNILKLRERFSSNSNVHIFEGAVSKYDGKATLYSDKIGSGLASVKKRKLDHYGIQMDLESEIQTVTFENFYNSRIPGSFVDLVKIDIEGLELDALEGFGPVIANCKVIQFEFGGCNIDSRTYFQDFWYFFKDLGFKLFRISPIGLIPVTRYLEEDELFRTTNYFAVRC